MHLADDGFYTYLYWMIDCLWKTLDVSYASDGHFPLKWSTYAVIPLLFSEH